MIHLVRTHRGMCNLGPSDALEHRTYTVEDHFRLPFLELHTNADLTGTVAGVFGALHRGQLAEGDRI